MRKPRIIVQLDEEHLSILRHLKDMTGIPVNQTIRIAVHRYLKSLKLLSRAEKVTQAEMLRRMFIVNKG